MDSLWKPGQPLPDNRWLVLGFLSFLILLLSGGILLASSGNEDAASGQEPGADSDSEPVNAAVSDSSSPRAVADGSAPQDRGLGSDASSTTTTTSRPAGDLPLPDVVGVEFNEALLELFDFDVRIEREDEPSDDVDVGVIIATDPEPGALVGEEATVLVTVSSGPDS